MDTTGIATVVSAIVGSGASGALVAGLLVRRRTGAETVKITAEADRVEVETSSQAVEIAAGMMTRLYDELKRVNTDLEAREQRLAKMQSENESLQREIAALQHVVRSLRIHITVLEDFIEAAGFGPAPTPPEV